MRLDSWKEIARYLQRDESTVQRWEKREAMPVHRHVHEKRGIDWYVVDIAGGEPIRTGAVRALRQAGVAGVPIPGAWARDDRVVFATYDDPASNVWELQMFPDSGKVSGSPRRLTFGTAKERSPAISASGRVAFTSLVENIEVWRLSIDGRTGEAGSALERVTDNPAKDVVMNVSADGRTLAFLSSRTGRDELWLRDLQTQQERQVTYCNPEAGRLRGDGALVAASRGPKTDAGIDLIPLAGGASSHLCDDCQSVDWSRDGERLLIRRGAPSGFYIIDIASRRGRELTAHPAWNLFQGRFSPDDRWVAFHTANTPALRQVFVVPTFTSGPVAPQSWIPVVTDFGMHPNWAPDGAGLYHFSLRDGYFCPWLQPVDPGTKRPSGPPRPLYHFHNPRVRAGAAAAVMNYIAAGYLYVTLTESTANIWMLSR
jgi:Tol biopolymer transport system component